MIIELTGFLVSWARLLDFVVASIGPELSFWSEMKPRTVITWAGSAIV